MESYFLFKTPAIFAQDKVAKILFIPIPGSYFLILKIPMKSL